jgi:DNA repair ATPase RecN
MPEFRGNVASVLTELYWDQELTRLRARQNEINQQVREAQSEKSLSREEQEKLREQLSKEAFTEEELLALEKGVSNGEYHYLGSAKILTQIGKAFAESMASLLHVDK